MARHNLTESDMLCAVKFIPDFDKLAPGGQKKMKTIESVEISSISNQFPAVSPVNFKPEVLNLWGWQFPENRLGETVEIEGVSIKKMLTMDINISSEAFASEVNDSPIEGMSKTFAKAYPCPHACPGCFNNAPVNNPIMTAEEVFAVIDQAIPLGLESVKFLGPGELVANPDLFEILDGLRDRGIDLVLFTKGAITGSDVLAQLYQGMDADELMERLVKYDNVQWGIGGRSFDPAIENKFIPTREKELRDSFNYHEARNKTIEALCNAGLNNNPSKPRISIPATPVTPETIGGVLEIFKWGFARNIPVCVTKSMVAGLGHGLGKSQRELAFEEEYESLAVDIYSFLIEQGAKTLQDVEREGVSSYVGMTPCNQLTHGLYVRYDGQVLMCPGNDTEDFIVANDVRESSLLDIWTGSVNYRINKFNNGCVKDGATIPRDFYGNVLSKLKEKFG